MVYREWKDKGIKTSLLGFGCMRLPTDEKGKINNILANELLEKAYKSGVNYFDNAYMYLDYQDEKFVGEFLSKKPRDSFYVTSKLPVGMIKSLNQAKEIFNEQLKNLQVEYFDFYLFHCLTKENFKKIKDLKLFDFLLEMKKEGKIHNLGFSFHDEYKVFEEILNYYSWDFCQIQYNYIDTNFQAGDKGYELAKKKGIPMVIMEPVRGGQLCRLSDEIAKPFKDYNNKASLASWGYRWVASHDNVKVVLSGMSSMDQVDDNLNTFSNFEPLNDKENEIIKLVAKNIIELQFNKCTQCAYCQPCPNGVSIPRIFKAWNNFGMFKDGEDFVYYMNHIGDKSGPNKCIKCGLCESKCPQHISIRSDLQKVLSLYNSLKEQK
ncbi:MAG: aldo/keto reductase [Bacilli bacterium]